MELLFSLLSARFFRDFPFASRGGGTARVAFIETCAKSNVCMNIAKFFFEIEINTDLKIRVSPLQWPLKNLLGDLF